MIFFIITLSLISQNYISKELKGNRSSSVRVLQQSFKDSLAIYSSFESLSKLDYRLLSNDLFEESKFVESKLIEIIRSKNDYINSALSNKYLKEGIEDLKNGSVERGKRKIIFASELDPLNRRILLMMVKVSFPNLIKVTKFSWKYFSTIKFLNNKIFMIKSLILFLILFSFWILIATIGASIVFSLSYITKWIQRTINFSGLWIGAILFSMFVWLPLQFVFLIIIAISLLKISKTNLIKCAAILFVLPFLISYSYIISNNFHPGSYLYREFKARFDPYVYNLDSPLTPYGYSIKGIEQARRGDLPGAENFFEKGYNIRRDINYWENLCSVYYALGDTSQAIKMCENVISRYPQNEIANITIIKMYYNQLNFDEATKHMERSGLQLFHISKKDPPLYKYPPERWLYKYVFVPRGLFRHLADKKLYFMIIIAICMTIMAVFKREEDYYCPICKSYMLADRKDENICLVCFTKLSLTKSKTIRERLKRRIVGKANKVDRLTNLMMSLVIPGSAHFYKKKHLEGTIICFFAAVILLIFLNSVLSEPVEVLKYRTSIGNNIFKIAVVLFYSLVMFSSWRLKPHGNGR